MVLWPGRGGKMNESYCLSSPWPGFNFQPWRSISRNISLADHTQPTCPEPAWQEMAPSPFNGTTQPVDSGEEGRSPATDTTADERMMAEENGVTRTSAIFFKTPVLTRSILFQFILFVLAADQTRAMQDQFAGNAAAAAQQDPNKAFKVCVLATD